MSDKISTYAIKSISAVVLASMLLYYGFFLTTKRAEAIAFVPVNDAAANTSLKAIVPAAATTATKETLSWGQKFLELSLKMLAKRLLAQMTQSTINWINSGFHGSPLFIQNPDSFFKDIAKSQVRTLVDAIGYDPNRFPFGRQAALNVISSYRNQFEINAQYSLNKVINDPGLLVQFRNNFNYGGWNGFLLNTQYPQNNYLGFNMMVQDTLASRLEGTIQAPAQKVQTALQQGMGFLSPKTCPDNPRYNNGINEFLQPSYREPDFPLPGTENLPGHQQSQRWEEENARRRAEFNTNSTCPGGLKTTTPGAVVANQIISATNTPFLQTALDGAIGNSLSAIFDALLNRLIGQGLNALANTVNPQPEADNWTYHGMNLGGEMTSATTSSSLSIPQNVSLNVGQESSITITGGIRPYVIQTAPNSSVAEAQISNNTTLTVTGRGSGITSFRVRDSGDVDTDTLSQPRQTVTVEVSVCNPDDLCAVPARVTTDTTNAVTVRILGGEGDLEIITRPAEGIAIANLSGRNIVVSGLEHGTTRMVIEDSATPPHRLTIPIQISTPEELVLQETAGVDVEDDVSVDIRGGVSPYSVDRIEDSTIATAEIVTSGSTPQLKIAGVRAGTTTITIKDTSYPQKSATISVTVTDPNSSGNE